VLLRRIFFINEDKSRYVSVGFYPSEGYQPLVEFGGTKTGPIRLTEQQVTALAEHLLPLCQALCANMHYSSGVHDGFWIIMGGSYLIALMYLGQRTDITFKLADLRYLNTIMHIVRNKLASYNSALTDVMTYAISALVSTDYIEPQPTYSKNILYPQLYEELKQSLETICIHFLFCNKLYFEIIMSMFLFILSLDGCVIRLAFSYKKMY